jgi:hypothetical protein
LNREPASFAIAASVASGALVVALVLHFGFRDVVRAIDRLPRETRDSGAAVVQRAADVTPVPAAPGQQAQPPPVGSNLVERDRQARVRDQVNNALAAQRAAYAACKPAPGSGLLQEIELNLTVAADGLEKRREFRAVGPGNSTTLDCLRKVNVAAVRVPAPGTELVVTVPFTVF